MAERSERAWWTPVGGGADVLDGRRVAFAAACAVVWGTLLGLGVLPASPLDVSLVHLPALALALAAGYAAFFAVRGRAWDLAAATSTGALAAAALALGPSVGAVALGSTAAVMGLLWALALPLIWFITEEA